MGQEKNAENIPFLRSTQPKSTERVPVVELSGFYALNFAVITMDVVVMLAVGIAWWKVIGLY